MGVVYEAQHLSLGRHVAIKVLPAHALLDARHLGRFQREARSAARLHHTNNVPVFGVGEQDGLHYYVMQFIQGLGLGRVQWSPTGDHLAVSMNNSQEVFLNKITGWHGESSLIRDGLRKSFQAWKAKDVAQAKGFLTQFTLGLQHHLRWEETILFPLFEQKTGHTGLTNTLRAEHEEIREWLSALGKKVEQNEADSDDEEKMLVEELGGHNAREEYALYPELDWLLTDEEMSTAFEAMAAVPEGS
jgi:regulator of cell morphogenesis and NO signaling